MEQALDGIRGGWRVPSTLEKTGKTENKRRRHRQVGAEGWVLGQGQTLHDPWGDHGTRPCPKDHIYVSQRDQRIVGTEVILDIISRIQTMITHHEGESPQKTDIFVGALTPSASVPLTSLR